MRRRFSLVVEHLSCKQKVMGSIPIVAFHIFVLYNFIVYVNTIIANKLLALVSNLISDSLANGQLDEKLGTVDIPLGQLCSRSLFANLGPNIKIETSPMYSYTTDIYTEAKEYGINNTLIEVYILATINVEFVSLKLELACSAMYSFPTL